MTDAAGISAAIQTIRSAVADRAQRGEIEADEVALADAGLTLLETALLDLHRIADNIA